MFPSVTKATSKTLTEAMESSNSTYKLYYFNVHGRGEIFRILWAYGGAKWEELPIDWPAEKKLTPFQCVPVVYETTPDGTVLQICETEVIERYLAKKFNLLGKNEWEQLQIEQIQSSTEGTQYAYHLQVVKGDFEKRAENFRKFYDEHLTRFIEVHENHLKNNGSNGFYVGESLSLADIKATIFIDRMTFLRPKDVQEVVFSAEKTPNLWKVRENVHAHPNIAEWKNSQRHKELSVNTHKTLNF
ncbi:hypothetical protein BGZ80_006277 [Entomortierella chlamydospora]|uniref:Glutathione S-transferase n=1 Tax=Entomortierella chlamydospora TaxID=101097 RepID=A0A9P6MHC0_9FUNG|nr:hypothetical protein BGZ80_006277 [Entomortierella chlamydospora]